MNTRNEHNFPAASPTPRLGIRLAPSLRVPVTPGNRSWLRRLRAAELAAWEAGRLCPRLDAPVQLAGPQPCYF